VVPFSKKGRKGGREGGRKGEGREELGVISWKHRRSIENNSVIFSFSKVIVTEDPTG
jgi:hypothetical protein